MGKILIMMVLIVRLLVLQFEQIDIRGTSTASVLKTQASGFVEERYSGEVRYFYDNIKEDDFIIEPTYYGYSYELTNEERDLVERTVMHESGWCPDYRLLILTAQCFRNDCELFGYSPFEAYENCGYEAMSYANPRAIKAVREVFDEGVRCVPERIFCYYNCNLVYSEYHESNRLAIDIDGNRFFY